MPLEYSMDLFIEGFHRRGDGKFLVEFTLKATTKPESVSLCLLGELLLEGKEEEIESLSSSDGRFPLLWETIFREGARTLSVLAELMGLPSPSSEPR